MVSGRLQIKKLEISREYELVGKKMGKVLIFTSRSEFCNWLDKIIFSASKTKFKLMEFISINLSKLENQTLRFVIAK